MRRISGNMLALLGLIFGITSGLGIVLVKEYIVHEIVDALNDELLASCRSCSLSYDSFNISFLRLAGRATNVKIQESGVSKVSFKEITATFSINEILDKKVYLDSLVFSRGHAEGVGPDSVLFRFIDQITTPLPPEQQNKERWRAILNNLEIRDTSLRESFGSSELVGNELSLFVKRIDENFVILPALKDLRYRSFTNLQKTAFSDLPLGQLTGSIVIEDSATIFNSLKLGRDISSVSIKGSADNDDNLTGDTDYQLDTQYIGLPSWLQGVIVGHGSVGGTLGSPVISGAVTHDPQNPLTIAFPNASQVKLSGIKGDVTVDVNHGDPVVTLRNISGLGPASKLTGTQPLTFSDKGLSAGFDVSLPTFTYGPFSITDATARIGVRPSTKGTVTTFAINTGDLQVQKTSLGPAKISLVIDERSISVKVDSSDPRYGYLRWEGIVDTEGAEPRLEDGRLSLEKYRYPLSTPPDPYRISPLEVTASIPLSGPIDLARLGGEGTTSITLPGIGPGLTMSGKTTLKDGMLTVNLPVSAQRGSANLKLDLARTFNGKLSLSLPAVPLAHFVQEAECGVIDASLDYSFSMSAPKAGWGSLNIGDLHVGCEPYVLRLPKNSSIPIQLGALRFKNTLLTGGDTTLELNGLIGAETGADLSVSGDLHLSSLLPLLPAVDNLQGLLSTKVLLKGPLSSPTMTGTATLSDGELAVASPDISAHDVHGRFLLAGDSIRLESFTGSINSGTFAVKGSLLPFDWANSRLSAELKEVTIEPLEAATITFSGQLSLAQNSSRHQALSGEINVDFAEISRDFDLNKILIQTIKGYFIPTRIQPQTSRKPVSLDLDVKLKAPRNIFVLTPFFSAELSADIQAGGTTTDPALGGSMQLLSGWVGLKGNRFDVTSGSLAFRPGTLTPNLELVSEGILRAPGGESVLVILEASGPLTSPRILLSSDRGLSQEELLLLITSSRSLTGRTMANRVGNQFKEDQRFFFSPEAFSSFEAFFSSLTKIDTLSFEPTYNPYTGLIEPAIVARKNLSSRFALMGDSLFSSVSNSRAGAVYNLTPALDVNGFVQSVSTQENIIFSSDLTYTILSEQPSLIEIIVEGLEQNDESDLLKSARIGEESRIKNNPESLATIQRDMTTYLRDQGYLSAIVDVSCRRTELFCQELYVHVAEGPRFSIGNVRSEGSQLPEKIQTLLLTIVSPGDYATATKLQEIERQLVIALRNEGYIAARISPTYPPQEKPSLVDVSVKCDIREPISFRFTGNKVFTAEQFLDSIDLFSRKRPFGNNTVKLLVQNIEQMYQENGYLFAQVSYTEDRSDPQRLVFNIAIAEEAKTEVRDLTISGNDGLPLHDIKRLMRELGFGEQEQLLSPTYAVPAQLDALENILLAVYQREGYPDVQISYTIEPVEDGSALDINYRVIQGKPNRMEGIEVAGFPSDVRLPNKPSLPVSLPILNQFIERVSLLLQEEGFLFPTIDSELTEDNATIRLLVQPGVRTHISEVKVEGLSRIDEAVARKYLHLAVGAPYRVEDINLSKRELLRSGLFSRVEVAPTDGTLDGPEESVTVRLSERALETLEVGTGANSEFGLHVFGEAVDKSLFADGRSLSMRVDSYFDQASINPSGSNTISQGFANLRYLDPFLFDSEYSFTEELRFQRQELSTQEFNLDRLLLASYLFRQLDTGVTFTGGHSLTFDNLVDVTPGAIISPLDEGHVRLSFLSGVLKLDRRDDPLSPQAGYTFTVEPRLSWEGLGSEANFGSVLARATGIVPLDYFSPRLSIGLGITGGLGQPFGDTDQIPITQRFYLGGRTTVRGFKENSLGPRGSDGAVIGGDTLIAQKNQLQYLVTDSLSTHLFFDLGNVYLRHESFALSDINASTGVGFQYLSPIGPIGFDVGRPIKAQYNESDIRFHFSVGSAF